MGQYKDVCITQLQYCLQCMYIFIQIQQKHINEKDESYLSSKFSFLQYAEKCLNNHLLRYL